MSLLTIIERVCGRTNVPVPTNVMGSISDTQILQLVQLLEEEGTDLARRGAWQGITFEASWSTSAAEDQGTVVSKATNGFNYIKNGTFWDRTTKLPVLGPLSESEWAALKGLGTTGSRYAYRIRGGKILVNPVPTASLTWAFEYASKNWILGADGTTYKSAFTLDTDTVLLPEDLLVQGLRWRWKREKGLDYSEDMRTYEMQVTDAMARDGGKRTLSMSGRGHTLRPGIFVPERNWSL